MTNWDEIDRLTLKQYRIMLEGLRLRNIDEDFVAHRQAWLNHEVQAEKQVGSKIKPVFDSFKEFFDYDALINGNDKENNQTVQQDSFEERIRKIYQRRKGGK